MTTAVFLEPLDVLFLRDNKLFGDPGSHGEALVPPWPSVAAGSLRSRILVDEGVDPAAFADGAIAHPELGTPSAPGPFTLTGFHLARRRANGAVELLMALPADLVVSKDQRGQAQVRALVPAALASLGLASSAPLPLQPVLAEPTRSKPASNLWLTEAGWCAYLDGKLPKPDQLVERSTLWEQEPRVGVGLSAETRRADDGKLFTVQAVAMTPNVGFLATVTGARLPKSGTVRFGGDGRAAAVHAVDKALPQPDYAAVARSGRCRVVLTTPALFAQGWLPNGVKRADDGSLRLDLHGVQARLVCAAVPRAETISGWDLARRQPKTAQRVAPTGSVYWFDELQATPEALAKLVERGLWSDACEDAARRAEGFNRVAIAPWTQPTPSA